MPGAEPRKVLTRSKAVPDLTGYLRVEGLRRGAWLALTLLAGCGESDDGLTDLDGRPTRVDAPVAVYVFLQPGCPVSERYAPEIARLRGLFPAASFWVVYPGRRFGVDAIRAHHAAFVAGLPALRDPALRLARACRVRVTPEAAVVTSKDGLVYHGRIDDLFVDLDVRRPAPTRRDLEQALEAVARGASPPAASAPAVGCPVVE